MSNLKKILTKFTHPSTAENSYFLSFEGTEGAGKSTQVKKFISYLEKKNYQVITLREPGGTDFGEKLRMAILEEKKRLNPLAEAHLFASARAELLDKKILPALLIPNTVVILDRYIDSSLLYQGIGAGLGIETILSIHQHAPLNSLPHFTYFLDISVETSMKRVFTRGNKKDYFEEKQEDFFHKLHQGAKEIKNIFPQRIISINGEDNEENISREIILHFEKLTQRATK